MLCCTAGLSHFHWTFDFSCAKAIPETTHKPHRNRQNLFIPSSSQLEINELWPWGVWAKKCPQSARTTFADESYAPQAERARNAISADLRGQKSGSKGV